MELKQLIEDYLKEARMMQVATAQGNQPWACTVYFAFDPYFNLYWISSTDRRHSQDIDANNMVAGTIVLPHTPGGPVRGIQFEGTAEALREKTAATLGMEYYAERFDMDTQRANDIIQGSDGHICYKIKPKMIVLFDEVNFPEKPRQEFTP